MKNGATSLRLQCLTVFILCSVLQLEMASAEPRARKIEVTCGSKVAPAQNQPAFTANFNVVVENISRQLDVSNFGLAESGSGSVKSYGLAQCYGDLSPIDCVLCHAEARPTLLNCFPFVGGRIFLDGCFLRLEDYDFFKEYRGPGDKVVCGNTTRKDNSNFQAAVRRALGGAAARAPKSGGYARGRVAVSGSVNESVYVLANCWKSLDARACRACLENASKNVSGCLPLSEGRALGTGCFMRYSDTDFLNEEQQNGRSRETVIVIIVSAVSSVVLLVLGIAVGLYVWKYRYIQKKRRGSDDARRLVKMLKSSNLNFKYSTLEKATESFAISNKLGQGGYGTVYKGALPDGREIAVKRLFHNNRHRAAEFYNEINIISSVEHKNLVRLLGCSCSGPESLLVYEFLPNQSLDHFIFDPERGKELDWKKRHEIIVGVAQGLAYLHEGSQIKIIHRDVKTSNILLDWKFQAKIADFGLVRSFQEDKSHISTAVAGTLGYMAPEYLAHGRLTEKADVYSFGVLVLEIITGQHNHRSKTSDYTDRLVTDIWKHYQMGMADKLYDSNLMLEDHDNSINFKNEILRVVHIGLLCTQEVPSQRPCMSKAVGMLTKNEGDLPAPNRPPFIDQRRLELSDMSENRLYTLHSAGSGSIATMSNSSFYAR